MWDDGLSEEQRAAAGHRGCHAVLIAGPGTGKTRTLTRRVIKLCQEDGVPPDQILVLTFTRVAAALLRASVAEALGPEAELPRLCTLHSYALSQLILSGESWGSLPVPVRVADDWEERNIVWEDLKQALQKRKISEIEELFEKLSADWETLGVNADEWASLFPDPKFLTAWHEHQRLYGYIVRNELVYQLERVMEREHGFVLPQQPGHLCVDEYQDLNACDLQVIRRICSGGAELFAAGDDDQSIYGFRHAFPLGIRRFPTEYSPAERFDLIQCHRCEQLILDLAQFVADLDKNRIEKATRSVRQQSQAEVHLLTFAEQAEEADVLARICRHLVDTGENPGDILILLRSDRYGAFSECLADALKRHRVPAVVKVDSRWPTDTDPGRVLLSIMRLYLYRGDSLSWRALLQLRRNRIGRRAIGAIHEWTLANSGNFASALQRIKDNPGAVSADDARIAAEVHGIEAILESIPLLPEGEEIASFVGWVSKVASLVIQDQDCRQTLTDFFEELARASERASLAEVLRNLALLNEEMEQQRDPNAVNIMTMHKAKGLSAGTVFVVAAEDEYVPGGNEGGPLENDDLRLLYVSMTRAQHRLYMTCCRERRGRQQYTGRTAGRRRRTLSRFLRDAPIHPEPGVQYLRQLLADSG